MGVWVGSGVATLHPQAEALVARYVYRMRDLDQMEHERIGQVWYSVCSAARVDPSLLSREAADELALEPGVLAVAAVKATNVSVELPRKP